MSDSASATAAVGVTIAVVLTLLIGGFAFFYIRHKRGSAKVMELEQEDAGRCSQVLDRFHPASKVTPFSADEEAPRFSASNNPRAFLFPLTVSISSYPRRGYASRAPTIGRRLGILGASHHKPSAVRA